MTRTRPAALLRSPATVAAIRIVRDRLHAATRAAERLADAGEADALHDFRVALRRLRSALRAYRPWLGRAASRKVRSALRDLGRATNAGRDGEVQADWLASEDREFSEQARAGATKLAQLLRNHRRPRATELQAELSVTAGKILKRLEFLDQPSPIFVAVYAPLLAEHAAAAAARVAAITGAEQVEEAHEARIAVKRLRYLLEPQLEELQQAPPLLERIEELQDLLGELHDAHVLEDTLASAGAARRLSKQTLAALRAENATRRKAVFADLEKRWLGSTAAAVFKQIQRLVAPAS